MTNSEIRTIAEKFVNMSNPTVRNLGNKLDISKSNIHKILTKDLKSVDKRLFNRCRKILDKNKAEKHIRGGLATRKKYKGY